MLLQWREEMEARFGLTFEILDREYIAKVRRERGYGVNPWATHPRFLVSQRLLIDEAYVAGLPPRQAASSTPSTPKSRAPSATWRPGSRTAYSYPPRPTTATPTAFPPSWRFSTLNASVEGSRSTKGHATPSSSAD
jgi:hypothetical protein